MSDPACQIAGMNKVIDPLIHFLKSNEIPFDLHTEPSLLRIRMDVENITWQTFAPRKPRQPFRHGIQSSRRFKETPAWSLRRTGDQDQSQAWIWTLRDGLQR